jgi:hypothetical protein
MTKKINNSLENMLVGDKRVDLNNNVKTIYNNIKTKLSEKFDGINTSFHTVNATGKVDIDGT